MQRARAAGLTHALCILAAENTTEAERARELTHALARAPVRHRRPPASGGPVQPAASPRSSRSSDAASTSLPEARAVGEIGLDYHYDFAPKTVQHEVFRLQIRLARELDLPIIIHTREAEDDTLAILREESGGSVRGVMHCFTGTPRLADEALALGMHISFAGIVTFPERRQRARDRRRSSRPIACCARPTAPTSRPHRYRGKRNEPAWVARVVEELAALRRSAPARSCSSRRRANFQTLFRP